MAVLSDSSLTNCLYIPDFIASGSKMLFDGTNAPTSWVKDTTHNNKALKIINGNVSSGGSQSFSSVFTTKSFAGLVPSVTDAGSIQPANPEIVLSLESYGNVIGSVVATNPPHNHSYNLNNTANRQVAGATNALNATAPDQTSSVGLGEQHNHNIAPGNIDQTHGHESSSGLGPDHTHPLTISSHDHASASSQFLSFSVYYRDVIIATKT